MGHLLLAQMVKGNSPPISEATANQSFYYCRVCLYLISGTQILAMAQLELNDQTYYDHTYYQQLCV